MYNIFKYLLLVLLCLMIGGDGEELAAASNTKTKTKIPPILPDDPLDLPPLFQDVSYRLLYTYVLNVVLLLQGLYINLLPLKN